jgi:hypothetical protein
VVAASKTPPEFSQALLNDGAAASQWAALATPNAISLLQARIAPLVDWSRDGLVLVGDSPDEFCTVIGD